ncbi:hypothetical protein LDENG_00008170 [Lucifuga dentata]|nr:hypothetical protein LDENG_00008170 [Lucifuga dentata]
MPPPAVSDDTKSLVRKMLREVLLGREDPEGFFALCLSVLGHRETRSHFPYLIQPLSTSNSSMHSIFTSTYLQYFSKTEDDQLEIALALSLLEVKNQQLPSLTQESEPQQPGDTLNQSGLRHQISVSQPFGSSHTHVVSTIGRRTQNTNSLQTRFGGKLSPPLITQETEVQKRPAPVLLWLRRDLRLCDNPALIGSLELGAPVIPVFIWSPEEEEEGPGITVAMGGACKYWLHQALSYFCSSLERIGSHLVFLNTNREGTEVGSSLQTLRELVKETGARTVLANALYEPWLKDRDEAVMSALQRDGVECRMYHSYCLRDPYSVSTEGVGLRGIGSVSHFMSCCRQNPGSALGVPLDPPVSVPTPTNWPQGIPLDLLGLARMPHRKDGTMVSKCSRAAIQGPAVAPIMTHKY